MKDLSTKNPARRGDLVCTDCAPFTIGVAVASNRNGIVTKYRVGRRERKRETYFLYAMSQKLLRSGWKRLSGCEYQNMDEVRGAVAPFVKPETEIYDSARKYIRLEAPCP